MAVRDAGSIIRELRLATGMSQWDFCDGICSVQTLSNIENGKQAISPIVFQSLTEKCGEMINPYPQFVSLDDFQCYMAVSNVDFYIDSWQFSIALDELRKIEESYFAENKLYYQQWLMYHAYILELSGHEDYAARKELLLHALSITGCDDINKISPKRMLLSVETRLLIMLGEVCILQNDQTNSSRILAIVEKQFPVSERNTGGRFPHGAVELLRQHYLLNFDPQKASVEGAYEDYHNAVNSFISVPTLRACFAYAAALYINGHYEKAEGKVRQLNAGSSLSGPAYINTCCQFLDKCDGIPDGFKKLFIRRKTKKNYMFPQRHDPSSMSKGVYSFEDGFGFVLGNVIKHLREKQGLSLDETCDGLCNRSVLYKIEKGDVVPRLTLAEAIIQRLGIVTRIFDFYGSSEEKEYYSYKRNLLFLTTKRKKDVADTLNNIESLHMAKDPLVQQYVMLWKAAALLPECEMEKELKKAIQLTQKNYAQNRLTKRMSWTEINIVQHICHCHYRNNPNKGIAETRELLSMLTNYNFPEEQCRFYIPVLMNNLSYYYYTNNTFSELDKMKEQYETPLMRYYSDYKVLYMFTHIRSIIKRGWMLHNLKDEIDFVRQNLLLIEENDLAEELTSLLAEYQIDFM